MPRLPRTQYRYAPPAEPGVPLLGRTYDLSTIVGRIVARLRGELGLTQVELAQRVGFDRSLLTRIEIGRNVANIEHLFLLEEVFIAGQLLDDHGDLAFLAARTAGRLRARGAVGVYGMVPHPENNGDVGTPALDRVVATTLDWWFSDAQGRAP